MERPEPRRDVFLIKKGCALSAHPANFLPRFFWKFFLPKFLIIPVCYGVFGKEAHHEHGYSFKRSFFISGA